MFWYGMPDCCVNKSLLFYHCLLILCIIVYKIYVKQYIAILLHFIDSFLALLCIKVIIDNVLVFNCILFLLLLSMNGMLYN